MKKKNDVKIEENVEEQSLGDRDLDREQMSDEDYIAGLEEHLGLALKEAESCKTEAKRIQAEFDNYRKRNNAIAEDMKRFGQSMVIEKLLSVLDNCDLARKYVQDEAALTGFNMMETQILSALDWK